MKERSDAFVFGAQTPTEAMDPGIVRQILGYGDSIMMVRVVFDEGAVGYVHKHFHTQVCYVESGEFDVTIDGVEQRLGPGDSFHVQPNLEHGAVCRKPGVLIDVFSPVREDFLEAREAK